MEINLLKFKLLTMGDSSALHKDGTFKTCPRPFHQVCIMKKLSENNLYLTMCTKFSVLTEIL